MPLGPPPFPPATPPPAQAPLGPPRRKSGPNWLMWGCLSIVGLGVLGAMALFLGGPLLLVRVLTDDKPMALPAANVTDEEWTSIEARVEAFKRASESLKANAESGAAATDSGADASGEAAGEDPSGLSAGASEIEVASGSDSATEAATVPDAPPAEDASSPAEGGSAELPELVLTADEINAIIVRQPEFADFKDRIRVGIEGDTMTGLLSVPLDDIPELQRIGAARGRYFNGTAKFKAWVRDGKAGFELLEAKAGDTALPKKAIAEINAEFAREGDPLNNPDARETGAADLALLEIADGKVRMRLKGE